MKDRDNSCINRIADFIYAGHYSSYDIQAQHNCLLSRLGYPYDFG